jgi:hypothetical protein
MCSRAAAGMPSTSSVLAGAAIEVTLIWPQ